MDDGNLVKYVFGFGLLGGVLAAFGASLVRAATGGLATFRGRAQVGCVIGLAVGTLSAAGAEVVLSGVYGRQWGRDLPTAAVVGASLGTLAGVAGGGLGGIYGGLVAGLLFGNLAVTTHIELLGRIVATIAGLLAGVGVAVLFESENPAGDGRTASRPARAGGKAEAADEAESPDVRFACRGCGKRLRTRGGAAGRLAECNRCGSRMRIPGESGSAGRAGAG